LQIRPRTAQLELVTPDGRYVGSLSAVPVSTPWWQDAAPVVAAVREHHGVDVTVLRLLSTEPGGSNGGLVTYLAEVSWPLPEVTSGVVLADHPLRLAYARPGGPAADLAWARSALREAGLEVMGRPEQMKTWKLSSLWRLPLADGSGWLKVVPPFFAHEGAMIEALAGEAVPRLLANAGPRIITAEIPGEDLFEATLDQSLAMVDRLVAIQANWIGRDNDLLRLGLPDWRGPSLTRLIEDVFHRNADSLTTGEREALDRFVEGLGERFAALASCGVPDTLVHGDFHTGNVRGVGLDVTILDWGDCGVGHPFLDQAVFLNRAPEEQLDRITAHWSQRWREVVPNSDPDRARQLSEPVAAARQAVIYQHFLDGIEPDEHVYHRSDPHDWLVRTAEVAALA
jgi:hypothetical protein